MSKFCCRCGKSEAAEQIFDGFCLSCYKEEFSLIVKFPEKQLHVTLCKLCGDIMYAGKWKEITGGIKSAIMEILDEFLSKTKMKGNTKKVLIADFPEPPQDIASKQQLTIIFKGTPKEEVPPYQQEFNLELIVNVGVCERCSKYARGYYEAIIQIRGDKREINKKEQQVISELIQQKRDAKSNIDRMAFITKIVDKAKGGVDLYVGSDSFTKSLTNFLSENLAASVEYSKKLKTMKDGKPVYQSTYCVRLPFFEIGDVVAYQNNPYQILNITFGRVEIINLKTKETKTLSLRESNSENLLVLKKRDQLQKFIIMSLQPPNVSVMNAISYEIFDLDKGVFFDGHKEGDEILMVELVDGYFECKKGDAFNKYP